MADTDIQALQASATTRIVGAAADGTETNPVDATGTRELKASDSVDNGAVDTVINLTTAAVEGKVGASKRTDRKYIWMQGVTVPAGVNGYIQWGFSNTTQSFKLFKDQLLCFPIGDGTEIWFKVPSGTGSVAFGEGS